MAARLQSASEKAALAANSGRGNQLDQETSDVEKSTLCHWPKYQEEGQRGPSSVPHNIWILSFAKKNHGFFSSQIPNTNYVFQYNIICIMQYPVMYNPYNKSHYEKYFTELHINVLIK